MTARPQRPSADDVRGLMAELGELVQDLGLETPPAEPPPAQADTAPPPAAEPPPAPEAVPMWEAAEAPPAALAPTLAIAPQRLDEAPRAWSPAAAMVVIEPAAPPQGHRTRALPVSSRTRRPHAFTIVTALAVLVAGAVFAFSRLDLGHTTGPTQPVSQVAFEVTGLRTVAAASAAEVSRQPLTTRFPSTVAAVYLDVTYRNVAAADAMRVVILLQPDLGNAPQSTVSDQTHTGLDPGGEVVLTVPAPGGGFTPGTYTVRVLHDGHLEQTATFQVSQAGG